MLLTNWLRSIATRCRSPRTQNSRQQRQLRRLAAASLSHALSTRESIAQTEVLEDRTLLTSVFTIDDVVIEEGNAGASSIIFTITRTGISAGDLNSYASVDFATQDGTATTSDSDYSASDGTVIFSADPDALTQTETIAIQVNGDRTTERNETFQVILSNSTPGSTIDTPAGTATIQNDDVSSLRVNSVSAAENEELTFEILLDRVADSDISFLVNTVTGTADHSDYSFLKDEMVTIEAGELSTTVTVQVFDDDDQESSETLTLELSDARLNGASLPEAVIIKDASATGTIIDNDQAVASGSVYSIEVYERNANGVVEGDSGTKTIEFLITRSGGSSGDLNFSSTVDFTTVDGTAIAGEDYSTKSTTLNFYSSSGTREIARVYVTVYGDTLQEYTESFIGRLSNPTGGSILQGNGAYLDTEATIINDDSEFEFQDKHTASPDFANHTGDRIGNSIAIDGDFMVAGAPFSNSANVNDRGAVYIYRRTSDNGTTDRTNDDEWTYEGLLLPDELAPVHFGTEVAISGDTIVVGTNDYLNSKIYIFTRVGDDWVSQPPVVETFSVDGLTSLAYFGTSLSIHENTIVIGAQNDSSVTSAGGTVFVIEKTGGTWTNPAVRELRPDDIGAVDHFGYSVSVHNDIIVVGAPGNDTQVNDSGAVYIFTKNGNDWTTNPPQMATIKASNPSAAAKFGYSVSTNGVEVAVGAYGTNSNGSKSGSVFVYSRNGSDWTSIAPTEVEFKGKDSYDYFGSAVTLDDNFLVVSASGTFVDNYVFGTVYIYQKNGAAWDNTTATEWISKRIARNERLLTDPDDQMAVYGPIISISNGTIALGSPTFNRDGMDSGVINLLGTNGTYWYSVSDLSPSESRTAHNEADDFGKVIALDENYMVVGAPGTDPTEFTGGQFHVYSQLYLYARNQQGTPDDQSDDTWVLETILEVPDPVKTISFGDSVAIYGDTIAVSALMNDGTVEVYLYSQNGSDWKTIPPDVTPLLSTVSRSIIHGAPLQIALDEDTVVIGNYGGDGNASRSGVVYVYTKNGSNWSSQLPTESILSASDGATYDYFGKAIAIDGDRIIVGAEQHLGRGAAYLYEKKETGWENATETKLTGYDIPLNARFGISVAIKGTNIAVSASYNNATGGVYVFKGASGWDSAEQYKFSAPDSNNLSTHFGGSSIGISENLLVVSSDYGAAYLYDISGEMSDLKVTKLSGSLAGEPEGNGFGSHVALRGNTLIIAADDPEAIYSFYRHTAKITLDNNAFVVEGDEGNKTVTLQVTRQGKTPGDLSLPASVNFRTVPGTATAVDGDYLEQTGAVLFDADPAATSQTATITIQVSGDSLVELDESFSVELYAASGNVDILQPSQSITIIENDQASVSIEDISVDESAGTATLTVSLDQAVDSGVSVDFSTADQSALDQTDYLATNGTVYFNPFERTQTITIPIVNSNQVEQEESFLVNLSNVHAGTRDISISDSQAKVTILDDDASSVPAIAAQNVVVTESSGTAVITVTLSQPVGENVYVDFTTADQTAISPDDYLANSGTIRFDPGQTTKTITVYIVDSTQIESNETFLVNLSNIQSTNADIVFADNQARVTIRDSNTPTISKVRIDDLTVNESAGIAEITVSLDQPANTTVSVDYATQGQNAFQSDDYLNAAGTILFDPGELTQTITISLVDNDLVEATETFLVNLSNLNGNGSDVELDASQATVTILDDDQANLSIDDLSVDESEGIARLTLSLDKAVDTPVSINYATADQQAQNNSDYLGRSGSLTFNPGTLTKTVIVPVLYSGQVELDESFLVNLTNLQSGGRNVVLVDNQAKITIVDEDQARVSISDITVNENVGTATLTVSLDQPVDTTVTIDYATMDQGIIDVTDYSAVSGSISFSPGQQTQTIAVPILDSGLLENTEMFLMNLSHIQANGREVIFADSQAEVTINDNDSATISIDDVTVNENDGSAVLTVSLSQPVSTDISIDYATASQSALVSEDFLNRSGTLIFHPGDNTTTISIPIVNSNLMEGNETFLVNLSNLQSTIPNITLADNQGKVTILDDDQPTFSIDDLTVAEDAGTATVTVTLNQALTSAVTVDYATADDSATSSSDYQSKTGTLTFNPGDTTQTIQITLTDSDIIEPDETFLVNLSNPQSGVYQPTLADSQAVVTIQDDDPGLLSINDITVDEDAGTALLTVSLDHPASTAISVDYATVDDSATSGSDYQSRSGTLTFNPGDTTQTIEITLVDSDLIEADETFLVNLSNLQNAGLDVSLPGIPGVVTIQDDDRASLSIQDLTLDEDAGTGALTVALDQPLQTSITVDFSTLDGTALVDADYSATSETLTFNPGETTKAINLTILDDAINESAESFFVKLANLQANGAPVDLTNDQAEITIRDDDQVNLSINDVQVNEDAGTATLTVTLEHALGTAFSVDYQTSDGTAVVDSDFLSSSGTLTFNPGDVSQTISVSLVNSDNVELTETLQVQLANLQGSGTVVSLADPLGEITILDDDQAALSINNVSVDEDAGTAQLTVSLDQAVDGLVQVDFVTADQTAVAGTDYQQTAGTLTFNPGESTKKITVTLVDNALLETDETFLVNLLNLQSHGLDVSLTDTQAEVTIHDNDQATLSVDDLTVDEDAGTVNLTVSLDHPVSGTITVDFETLNGTAFSAEDYTANSGTLTFNPGETTQTITLEILNDDLNEAAESFFVNLTNLQANGYQVNLVDAQSEITIISDEFAWLSINNVTVSEDSGLATLTVTLDQPLDTSVSVNYATANYLSISGYHYESTAGTLTFNPGEQTHSISVPIIDNDSVESDRIFFVNLSDIQSTGNRIELGKDRGLVTILEDDQAAFSVDDVVVDEDTGYATVSISLSAAVKTDINLFFNTSNQTAIASQDYTSRSGVMLVPFDARTHTYRIPIIDSDQVENDETFLFNLTGIDANGLNVVLADDQGLVTIRDNDQASISVQDLNVNEAAGKALVTVSLDKPVDGPVSLDYSTLDQSATASSDYIAKSGTLTFTPGTLQQTIEIDLVDGAPVELPETFDIQFSNLQTGGLNVILPDDRATVTIKDDDLGDYEFKHKLYAEGTAHDADRFGADPEIDGDTLITGAIYWHGTYSGEGAAFIYVRNDQGTPEYTGDDTWDYQATLSPPDADSNADYFGWSVDISGDTAVVGALLGDGAAENMGTVYVYTRSNGAWSFQQKLSVPETIDNGHFGDTVAIEGDTLVVGAQGTDNNSGSAYVFTRENGTWSEQARLTADSPQANAHFAEEIEIDNSTIVIGAVSESGTLAQSGAVYIYTEQAGTWTRLQKLTDPDPSLYGAFGNAISIEGDLILVGATSATDKPLSTGKAVLFQRDPDSGLWTSLQTLTASDSILNSRFGTEVEIHDQQLIVSSYNDPTGIGNTGAVYVFEVENQTWVEQQKISYPDTGTSSDFGRVFAVAEGAILISARLDDETVNNAGSIYVFGLPQNPPLTIGDVSVTEADDGSRLITATVTRTATRPGELIYGATVDFRTVDGTATTADGDYQGTTGTLTFESDPAAESQTQTISIRIYGDAVLELDETFGIELLNVTGHAHLSDSTATVTIENDDQATLSIDDITLDEDAGTAILTVSLDHPVDASISINYATANQSALAGSDYTSSSGTLTFNPGDQTQTITVPILYTTDSEPDETFLVNLSDLQNQGRDVSLVDAQATVTITDRPPRSEFSIKGAKIVEGDDGFSYLQFEIHRTTSFAGGLDFETTVDFSTLDDTAIAGADYVSLTRTLTFSADSSATSQVQYLKVQVIGDRVKEDSETVIARLSNATGGSVFPDDAASTQAAGIIANDDTDYYFQEFLYADPAYANHTEDNAGQVLAIDGDVMVMGVPDNLANGDGTGAAYVYVRNQQGTPADQSDDTWEFETVLFPETPVAWSQFGASVAINGDTIVIGADREDGGTGAIYVFTRNGADWKTEPPSVEKLTVQGLSSSAYFGYAVSIYEDTIVVGARFDSSAANTAGAVYLFEKSGADWSNPATRQLIASDYQSGDYFGSAVSISGDLIVVGTSYASVNGSRKGAAYVYSKNGADWTTSAPSEAKLIASNGIAGDSFGISVATNGTEVAIGANNTDAHGSTSGSTYLYLRNGSDWSTSSPTELEFTGKSMSDKFGTSVGLTADRLVVGAFNADPSQKNTGAVYVFSKTGANWDLDNAAENVLEISTDEIARLGEAVAISGSTIVAGAPDIDSDGVDSGAAYIFEETAPQNWLVSSEISPTSSTTAHSGGDRFGKVIASDENYLVVGAPGTDSATAPAGVVYVYARDDAGTPDDKNDDLWVYQTSFAAPDPADTYTFGSSVDVQGDTILVSAALKGGASEVYIYEMNGADWTTVAPTRTALFDSVSRAVSQEVSVAIDGDTIVTGVRYSSGNQSLSGSALVYTRNGSDWSTLAPTESVLTASDGATGDYFGYAVDVSGDQIIVGAYRDDNQGSAYLYQKGTTGWDTATETKLTSQDTQTNDYFGKVVAIEDDLVAVASPQSDTTSSFNGAVYLFDGSQGWANPDVTRLTPLDNSNASYYGSSLALQNGTLVVGNAGGSLKAVYIYDHLTGDQTSAETVLSFPTSSDMYGRGFGAAVALQGNNLVVTSLYNEATAASRIYSFNRQTPVISIENTSIVENDDGTQDLQVTVTATGLIPGIYAAPSVDFTTLDGSATAQDDDYQALSGTLYFDTNAAATTQTQTITIQINGDDKVEADETFSIELSNPSMPAVLAQTTSEITLQDNDAAGLSIDDITVDEDAGTATLTVSLDHPVDGTVTIDYATADQSALAGSDYTGRTGPLVFNPGDTSQTIVISIADDDLVELDETLLVNLSGLQAGGRAVSILNNQAQVTIRDNDQATLSIDDLTVNENTGSATLTVSLDHPVDSAVSIDYATADETAIAGSDYPSTTGTLTFNPGDTSQTIVIPITDDDQTELDETFLVNLSGLQAGGRAVSLADNQARVTIKDDDQITAEVNLRVVDTPSSTSVLGETASLPTGLNLVSEWSSYWVEIWIDAQNPAKQGVFSASLDLSYQTQYTTATEIEFGPAFTQNQGGLIDDATGNIQNLSAETQTSHLGVSRHLLFARIKFEPRAEDQVQIDRSGQSIGPYDLGFEISASQVAFEGDIPLDTVAGASTGTEIWANPYDLNDDNQINFRDLILFASVYNTRPSESSSDYAWFADLNQNDRVEFRDLILFASNYNKTRENRNQITYPDNFPEAWNQQLTVDTQEPPQPGVEPGAEPLAQSTAQSQLASAVEEVSPALAPDDSQKLKTINIQVTDLDGDTLGRAAGNTIYIDSDAAGYGWFIDATPATSEEFTESSDLTLIALPDSDAAGRIDLRTVIMHELGHLLGYDHEASGWMQESLVPGVRQLPAWDQEADQFFTDLTEDLSIFL